MSAQDTFVKIFGEPLTEIKSGSRRIIVNPKQDQSRREKRSSSTKDSQKSPRKAAEEKKAITLANKDTDANADAAKDKNKGEALTEEEMVKRWMEDVKQQVEERLKKEEEEKEEQERYGIWKKRIADMKANGEWEEGILASELEEMRAFYSVPDLVSPISEEHLEQQDTDTHFKVPKSTSTSRKRAQPDSGFSNKNKTLEKSKSFKVPHSLPPPATPSSSSGFSQNPWQKKSANFTKVLAPPPAPVPQPSTSRGLIESTMERKKEEAQLMEEENSEIESKSKRERFGKSVPFHLLSDLEAKRRRMMTDLSETKGKTKKTAGKSKSTAVKKNNTSGPLMTKLKRQNNRK